MPLYQSALEGYEKWQLKGRKRCFAGILLILLFTKTRTFFGLLVFVASDGVLVSKFCWEAETQEFFKTHTSFMEIPPRDGSIKLIDQ